VTILLLFLIGLSLSHQKQELDEETSEIEGPEVVGIADLGSFHPYIPQDRRKERCKTL
jgi:hypothetical protein